jgi:hypothetical protein
MTQEVVHLEITDRSARLAAYQDRWSRMRRVIEARAQNFRNRPDVAGDTGLIIRTERMIGAGASATLVEEFAVDTGLLKAMAELEKQAAIETGQWVEKQDYSTFDWDLSKLSGDERQKVIAKLE